MKISVFDDPRGAGMAVSLAAARRGHVITDASPDVAYVRTLNYGTWKEASLGAIAKHHARGVPSLPSYRDSLLYDDKAAQAAVLQAWMPKTFVITRREDVPIMRYPFISKSKHGSASHNVRLIVTREESDAEIRAAFGEGLAARNGVQKGYLIWQEFVPGNEFDVRVVVAGEHVFGLRRFNRPGTPFASGSGKNEPLTDGAPNIAFKLACDISAAVGTRWACYDFVYHHPTLRTYVLEMSFSWTEKAYDACPTFDRQTLLPTGRFAVEWPEFAVNELERIAASRALA